MATGTPAEAQKSAVEDELSSKPAALSKQFQAKQFRVIVLGAGMSGLACARELIQRGYQVLVVEARDRVGGRLKGGVKTNDREGGSEGMKTLPGAVVSSEDAIPKPIAKPRSRKDTTTPVDLGGALIHGIEGNPIYAITEQMGVPTRPVSECLLFNGSGWPVDTREDERISAIFNECLEETFDRIAAANASKTAASAIAHASASAESAASMATPAAIPTDSSSVESTENHPPNRMNGDDQKKGAASPCGKSETTQPPSQAATSRDESNKDKSASNLVVPPDTPGTSFGDIFDRVCEEKGAPVNNLLFQWHQSNLEVSCGASFPGLGYKWNDDEPYGYDGAHVAVKTSWKPVMEGLAEGVDILYQSPVKQVTIVTPDPPPEPPPDKTAELEELKRVPPTPAETPSSQASTQSTLAPNSVPVVQSSVRKIKRKRVRTPSSVPLPSRRSRRLQGDDADARRSLRATKGQKVDRFVVSGFGRDSYVGDSQAVTSPNQRGTNQRKRQLPDIDENQTRVQVALEDGTVLEANAVVCTLPLGVLKLEPDTNKESENNSSGCIRFYPPLSERKQNAIQRLGCGLLNKCILSFSHVFWQNSDFLGLAHPANSYLVLNASTFTNKPILTFMYGGTFAKEIESWTDNEIVADCLEVLKIICGRDIPDPLDYVVTRWGKEQYSRMAFSYVPPGVDGTQELKAMSEAVYDPLIPQRPVLMFAGEHTTPFHPSTIHGAFLSGIREAYRLDLFVEPEANEHLEFEEEHLYQHTFAVRQLFQSVNAASAHSSSRASASNAATARAPAHQNRVTNNLVQPQNHANKRQHRRRGAATVMNLRERPDGTLPDEESNGVVQRRRRPQQPQLQDQNSGQNGTFYSPARRSRRSLYSFQQQNALEKRNSTGAAKKAPATADEALLQKKRILSLEGRTIMRALESYGYDYSYLQSIVLPVYGNSFPQKSTAQLRARCQQLIRSMMTATSASVPKRILDFWVAKKVHKPPPPGSKKKGSKSTLGTKKRNASSADARPEVRGTRRSSREPKQRQIMSL